MSGSSRGFRGWLRRNAAALLALVVIVPGCAAVLLGLPWSQRDSRHVTTIVAPRDGPVEFAGATWEVTASQEFVGTGPDGNRIPVGSAIVAALVDVVPGDEGVAFCSFRLVDPVDGAPADAASTESRVWEAIPSPSSYNYETGEETSPVCDEQRTEPYELELVYLTPEGTYDAAVLDLSLGLTTEDVLRFPLPR